MGAFVDRSTGRTKCKLCGEAIAKGAIRVVLETVSMYQDEERVHRGYWHLGCSLDIDDRAYFALIGRRTTEELFAAAAAELDAIDRALADRCRAARPAPIERRAVALSEPTTDALLAELEARPHDTDLLTVLADQLQQRGDERGELIMLDLAAPAASGTSPADVTAIQRRSRLRAALSPDLPRTSRVTWGAGFFKKLALPFTSTEELTAILAHPSCRMLEELELEKARVARLVAADLPRTLRTIKLHGRLAPRSDLAGLPHLAELHAGEAIGLAHPTLRALQLEYATCNTLQALAREKLPSLVELALLRHEGAEAVTQLIEGGWLAQLRTLSLTYMVFQPRELEPLEHALAGRRLERLTVIGTTLQEADRPRLAALCDQLVLKPSERARSAPAVTHVEHANKPEWGRGTVVREFDGKLEIAFESGGTRTFKADAPFLRRTS